MLQTLNLYNICPLFFNKAGEKRILKFANREVCSYNGHSQTSSSEYSKLNNSSTLTQHIDMVDNI